jgi:hypothetical protein
VTVRQKVVDTRLREFLDAVKYVEDRPLLLWASSQVDEAARTLVAAVAAIKERSPLDRAS